MRGNDDVIDEPLFPGTATAAEGHLAEVLFKRAKEEGCNMEVNWQDNDSSAAKSVALISFTTKYDLCWSCRKSTYTQTDGFDSKEVLHSSLHCIAQRVSHCGFSEVQLWLHH